LLGGIVAALGVMSGIFFIAALALRGVPRLAATARAEVQSVRPGMAFWVICGFAMLMSCGFGMVEGNVPGRMEQYGIGNSSAGVFMAMLSVGSCIGGLAVSLRPISRRNPIRHASLMFWAFALLILPSALAPNAWVFGLTLLFVSLMLVPLNGLGAAEVEARLGRAGRGQVFSIYLAATIIGGGLGTSLNGVLASFIQPQRIPLVSVVLYVTLGIVLAVLATRQRNLAGGQSHQSEAMAVPAPEVA
jgi:predicted MFS family arabinose efflux permease